MEYWLLFFVGTILGSFFNVVGIRVPLKQSFMISRSRCFSCGNPLSFKELIPIISYLWQRGKCNYCSERISPLYAAMEFATALLFIISYFIYGQQAEFIVSLLFISLLVIISITDIYYMIIPNRILVVFAVSFLLLRIVVPADPWWSPLLGAAIGFSLLFLIMVSSRGGIGGGDVKLLAVLGIILGWQETILALFFAAFFGAAVGIVGLMIGLIKRRQPIPFAPFIGLGAIIAYFWTDPMMAVYTEIMLKLLN